MTSNTDSAIKHLKKVDPLFARLIEEHGIELATNVKSRNVPYFHILIRSVINQQLSVKAAQTILDRVLSVQGGRMINAKKLSIVNEEVLRQCGISRPKIRYINGLCQAVLSGQLNFRKLAKQDDESIRLHLTMYPGIGEWSADMFLMQAMGRQDILPLGDLVLRKSMQKYYGISKHADLSLYHKVADRWRPYRSLACRYLWAGL